MREPLLCRCFRITEAAVRKAIREEKLTTVEEVSARTRAATGCSSCYDDIQALLNEIQGVAPRSTPPTVPADLQTRALIAHLITEQVRPLFQHNGIDLELLDVHTDRVFVRYHGPTVNTTLPSILTLKAYLVRIMSDACGRKMQQIEMNVLDDQGACGLP